MVTWENYEEYMMMRADGELGPAEEQALSAFLRANPELEGELAAYQMARLTPDTSLVFSDKRSLLRQELAKRTIAFPRWQRYSIAAGIAAIIFISFFKFGDTKNDNATIVKAGTEKTISNPEVQAPVKQQDAIVSHTTAPAPVKDAIPVARSIVVSNKNLTKQNISVALVATLRADDKMERLTPGEVKALPQAAIVPDAPPQYDIPELTAIAPIDEPEKKSLFDKLPIDDIKKTGMEDMTAAISKTYRRISAIKSYDPRNITVRIEKKQLKLTF